MRTATIAGLLLLALVSLASPQARQAGMAAAAVPAPVLAQSAAATPVAASQPRQDKPFVFISCSTEALPLAEVVANDLRYVADTVIWDQGAFHLSQGSLDALDEAADRVDFAVVILTPDDVVTRRGVTSPAARDNTIFELGFFMGMLGIQRVFMVYDRGSGLVLPSNLSGITAATYSTRADGDLEAALGPAATQVMLAIRRELAGAAP